MAFKPHQRILQLQSLGSDHLRIPLQTVCAVALAYIAGWLFTSGDVSWTVFSAIFVVQASAGGTWGSALDRSVGALLGALLGYALTVTALHAELPLMGAMILGVAIMSAVTAYRPGLSYGLVTVAILTVAPHPEMLQDAMEKVWAVTLGSLCAAVAGSLILPVSISRRARQDLEETANALALWLHASTEMLLNKQVGPFDSHHRRMDHALEDARATLWGTGSWLPRGRIHNGIELCRNNILALRFSVAILDRLGWTPLPAVAHDRLRDPLMAISLSAQSMLVQIANNFPIDESTANRTLDKELHTLREAIAGVLAEGGVDDRNQREHLHAVAWAWSTLTTQMHRAVQAPCQSGQSRG